MDRLVESLKFFVRVVEKKGIASAGNDFGMPPATASERLAALESYYETKLINRTTRSISLTDEGRILFEGAKDLINQSNDLENKIRLGTDSISGHIRMSAPQDLGSGLITTLINQFVDTHPNIQIDLNLDDKYVDLVSHGIDLSIRLGHIADSSLRMRKLADNHRIVCASPDYLKTYGVPKQPSDLKQHNCLIMNWGHIIDHSWTFKVKGCKEVIQVSGNRSSNNGAHVKQWCLDGYGLALKSIWDTQKYLATGELVEVLQDFRHAQKSALQILYPGGHKPAKRVRALINYLAESFKDPNSLVT